MYKLDHFLKLLKEKKPFAYVGIADGEMGAILKGKGYTTSKKYQVVTKELQGELKKALLHHQDNYYIGHIQPRRVWIDEVEKRGYKENEALEYRFKYDLDGKLKVKTWYSWNILIFNKV